eukprot:COSAG04_NODE_6139_length_1401_cov_0.725038_2_plen_74_part_00
MRSRLVSSNPDDMLIETTFREGGPLGLKLNEEEGSGRAVVVKINMGTQVRFRSLRDLLPADALVVLSVGSSGS